MDWRQSMNKFEYPEMFWLLILPFFFYIILPKVKGLHGDAIRVPFIDDIKNIECDTAEGFQLFLKEVFDINNELKMSLFNNMKKEV